MNPDISINVWEWKEESATAKPVVASKNFYISGSCKIENCKHPRPNEYHEKRPHIIHLMALTDITKSVEEKYGQKNHFLWIKNANGLVFKDTAHHGEKHLCNRYFQSFPSEKSLVYHQPYKKSTYRNNTFCICFACVFTNSVSKFHIFFKKSIF